MRSVSTSSTTGIRARTRSRTPVIVTPRLCNWAVLPPGHGSLSGSATGVPATMSSSRLDVDICCGTPCARNTNRRSSTMVPGSTPNRSASAADAGTSRNSRSSWYSDHRMPWSRVNEVSSGASAPCARRSSSWR
jgi:hypothetical protein